MTRIGIIQDTAVKGRGGHGTHLAFWGIPGVEIAALADSNPENTEDRLTETGAKRRYFDYREMLAKEALDIVVVTSRLPGDHLAPIQAACEHKCHILCEKPLCADLREADEIVRLARQNGVRIAVAHLARYALVFRTMKRMLEAGAIGRPLTFYGRGKEDERGGGEDMMVLGTHILDLASYLFGAPDRVYAEITMEGRPLRYGDRLPTSEPIGLTAGDDVHALYRFPGQVKGVFESRKGVFREQVRMGVTVAGTEGMLAVRYDDERKLRISKSSGPPEDETHFEEVPLGGDIEIPGALPLDDRPFLPYFLTNNRLAAWDLMQAIAENREPLSSAADARMTLEMIIGTYASALTGAPMKLPLNDRRHPLEKGE